MYILRPKKFTFAFMSYLLLVRYIFQLWHLQAYYKRGLIVVWRRRVPTGSRYVLGCVRSHSDLFLKIDTNKKRQNSWEILWKESVFIKVTGHRSVICQRYF